LVTQLADVAVTKTQLTNPAVAGHSVSYQLAVTNYGPSDAPAVVLSDLIPKGTTYVGTTYAGGGAAPCTAKPAVVAGEGGSINCELGYMAIGSTQTLTVTFDLPKTATGTLVNTSLVGSAAVDPDSSNNTAIASGNVRVPPATDVAVTVTAATPGPLPPGASASFTTVVKNNGPAVATATTVTFTLPPGLTGAQVKLTSASGGLSPGTCVTAGLQVVCQIGNMPVGTQAVYQVTGHLAQGLADGALVTLEAVSDHNEVDSVPANDRGSASIRVQTAAPWPPPPPDNSGKWWWDGSRWLPITGTEALSLLQLAAILALAGAALLVLRRGPTRRHT